MTFSGVSNVSVALCVLGVFGVSSVFAFETSEAQSHQAAPPEDAGSTVKFPEKHPEASRLNRYNFAGNVLRGTGDHAKHWIVIFCTDWHERCHALVPSYELLGAQWEEKLNENSLFGSSVRFAKVDCATEKELCTSQGVEDYPTVKHYEQGRDVGMWTSGAPGLVRWVKQELTGKKPVQSSSARSDHSHASKAAAARQGSAKDDASKQSGVGCSKYAASASCESFHQEPPQHVPARANTHIASTLAGFILMLTLGIGRFLTPQLFRPQQQEVAVAADANVATSSTTPSSVETRPTRRNRQTSGSCIPKEWGTDRMRIDL
mmetsp:Transcript_127827/g.221645  ORF Transcript_127827/g.221645 Transcript_127827/m.221645 type:complete len:319 (+) Transcript_127827:91-1047(+)